MKSLTVRYDSTKALAADEDLRLKGLAFDLLDAYFRSLIKNDGASGILAAISSRQSQSNEDLVYKLTEHFRQHLNSVYKNELES